MSFASPFYLPFLMAVLVLWWAGRRLRLPATALLVAVSFFFYATWNPLLCLALLGTATLDHFVCLGLGRAKGAAARRALVALSVTANLSALVFFKYFNFLADAVSRLSEAFGPGGFDAPFKVVFAVGVSFYTFQSMGLVIDVFRREAEPPRSFLRHLAFVSFFPTLLAGPITRGETLLPQLAAPPSRLSAEDGGRALFLIGLGMFKKLVLADYVAANLVNRVFELPGMYSSLEVLGGIYGYAAQIYCDFSGYSDVAIGSALLLGFKLKDNFNSPYRASDLVEFWRRWHISFSTWLRDYLFASLPGNKRRFYWPYMASIVTFTLGGLWHGASWNFVFWGLLHGIGLAFLHFVARRRRGPKPAWRRIAGAFVTFHFVAFGWLFFRCADLAAVGEVLARLRALSFGAGNLAAPTILAVAAAIGAQWLPEGWYKKTEARFAAAPAPLQAALLAAVALAVGYVSTAAVAGFIYFNF